MTLQSLLQVRTNRDGVVSRRSFLRNVAAGAAGAGILGWKDAVTLSAEELRKQGLACVLMFMRGGPSQFETFDPKPGVPNGGPTKAIATAVEGIQIAEAWPTVAKAMKDIVLVRSMTNREGEHQRAAYQMHTGYVPNGSVKYPSFGSIVATEKGSAGSELPHFVSVGGRLGTVGSGYLGANVAPFIVGNPEQMPSNVELPSGVGDSRFNRRVELLKDLEEDFAAAGGKIGVQEHGALYANASKMVLSPKLKAFDVSQEKDAVRDRYGRNSFGQGCLLARRLIEAGVTFVEVESNGWDTHNDNFNRVKSLAGSVDPGFGSLVMDLKERGMLDKTLVIWMGEFGRTPRVNGQTGRDHYPRAFSIALAGAGIQGGRVLGATSDNGSDVKDRPVGVADLFCTFCEVLNINPRKEFLSPLGRPIKIVDGGETVKELIS